MPSLLRSHLLWFRKWMDVAGVNYVFHCDCGRKIFSNLATISETEHHFTDEIYRNWHDLVGITFARDSPNFWMG